MWAAAHGDINLITALPRATAPGLQVKVDDEWVDAVAPDDGVIVNTGIMLERLTNGAFRSAGTVSLPHRASRASATAWSSSVTRGRGPCCHPCRRAARPTPRSGSSAISAADALDEVLYEINLVEGARRIG